MARDYSSRRNNPPDSSGKRKAPKRAKPAAKAVSSKSKASPKKTGSNRGGSSAPPPRTGTSGCIWLVCGLLIAVVGGSIYYIASRPAGHGPQSVSIDLPEHDKAEPSDADAPAGAADKSGQASASDDSQAKPRFSFYKMLPNYKVQVPAGEQRRQAEAGEHAPHEAEPAAETPAPTGGTHTAPSASSPTSAPASTSSNAGNHDASGGYIIQAGAFSTHDDADRRKARLALLGVTADIIDIRTSSGKTLYRVQSNTLASRDKARNLAQRLSSHGIETMVRQAP